MNQTQQATPTRTHTPTRVLHLWHLLSLDAPTVATLWTWFIASTVHLPSAALGLLPWPSPSGCSTPPTVCRSSSTPASSSPTPSTPPTSKPATSSTTATPPPSSPESLSLLHPRRTPAHLPPEAIHLYPILGALLFGWFLLIHARAATHHRLPKELAVGIFFPAAIFIPTVARQPDLRLDPAPRRHPLRRPLQPQLPLHLRLGAPAQRRRPLDHPLRHPSPHHPAPPPSALAGLALAAAIAAHRHASGPLPPQPAPSAPSLSSPSTATAATSPLTLRAAADLALLTPLLFIAAGLR